MAAFLGLLFIVALAGCAYLAFRWLKERASAQRAADDAISYRSAAEVQRRALEVEIERLKQQVDRLSKWEVVANADEMAKKLIQQAKEALAQAESDARIFTSNSEQHYEALMKQAKTESSTLILEAKARSRAMMDESERSISEATSRSQQIVLEAEARAKSIAGKAYEALKNSEFYERTAKAMRNVIEGYGDEYLKPAESVLDDLAEEFSHKDAGRKLKSARDHTQAMVKDRRASRCDYVDENRRRDAERFVLHAFNGNVDTILARVRHDNYGKLEQEIKDAFNIVNAGGKAFRDARVTDEYLASRLEELRWATVVHELKRQEQEEQRRIREQIREEEKARKEYERAIREAAKEKDVLRKAMAKAQEQIAAATHEQRARYESQLAELGIKLKEAEERNRRALSMAQQTKRGHVYIISNVGSFGENVLKIGLTRRLEPLDRVKELGDASVPFDFDVHAIILSDDAPAHETKLHKHFVVNQVNKVNHRKEFFRAALADIRSEIELLGIEAKWTMLAEAREYRETLAIEKAIADDAVARQQWINRQLTLDPVNVAEPVAADASF